jgi:hypothetical protein
VTGPQFSYEMPSFGMSTILSYSTLQNLGLGVGSSNSPLQGSMGGTLVPYNDFPYGGGHIPPSFPSLGGACQHSVEPNVNYSSFGVGSKELPSYSIPVGSTSFSLFDAFGNNSLLSAVVSAVGNLGYGKKKSYAGYYSCTGGNLRNSFLTRTLESVVGFISLVRDVDWGKPLP